MTCLMIWELTKCRKRRPTKIKWFSQLFVRWNTYRRRICIRRITSRSVFPVVEAPEGGWSSSGKSAPPKAKKRLRMSDAPTSYKKRNKEAMEREIRKLTEQVLLLEKKRDLYKTQMVSSCRNKQQSYLLMNWRTVHNHRIDDVTTHQSSISASNKCTTREQGTNISNKPSRFLLQGPSYNICKPSIVYQGFCYT